MTYHHDEVLVLAMNRILLDAGVSEGCEELDALDLLGIVVRHVNVPPKPQNPSLSQKNH